MPRRAYLGAMPGTTELVAIFREIGDLLDLQGVRFKPEAYRRAARSLEALTEDLAGVAARGELRAIPGVGEALAEKIEEYLRTGAVPFLDRIRSEVPPGLLEIMRLPGFGPKTARRLWVELGIEGPGELAAALAAHRLDGLAGFGPRKIALLSAALAQVGGGPKRRPLVDAWRVAEGLLAAIRTGAPVDRVEVAGSLRRRRETVGDLDILATSTRPERVFEVFSALPEVRTVRMRGPTKETVELSDGLQVDLRVVEPAAFGAALQYFTGSKDHNVHLRSRARDRGLKVNEYGVFRGEERVAGATEDDVYAALGLPTIPAEIREDHGEIEAAEAGRLPTLVDAPDVRGLLHVHLERLGGTGGLPDAARAARRLGFEYLGVVVPEADGEVPALPRPSSGAPRIFLGIETARFPTGPPPGADFWFLRPAAGLAVPPASAPGDAAGPLLVAHLAAGVDSGAEPDRLRPWLALAAARPVAFEVTAGAGSEGLDSTFARQAVEAGAQLALGPGDVPVAAWERYRLAVGLARRAWAAPETVLNARPAEELARSWAARRGRG